MKKISQIKTGHPSMKQKARPYPYHVQKIMKKSSRILSTRDLKKMRVDCFVTPVGITVNKTS